MKTVNIDIDESASYTILIGAGILQSEEASGELCTFVEGTSSLIVSDNNVAPLYLDTLSALVKTCKAPTPAHSIFKAGEASKTLETMGKIFSDCVKGKLDRSSMVFALGGGVVGDMAGFGAACYMRGIPFVQVPTSLLAMVDSSVGGKTGCDLPEGKNLVGAFHQPSLVLTDLSTLKTLPEREIACGLAEIVKTGVLFDKALFSRLEDGVDALNSCDLTVYEEIIARCCEIKAWVVEQDEKEKGMRALLNYGHTFGHAIESLGNYTALNHGEAVAVGMGMAADLAVILGDASAELRDRQDALLKALKLPTTCRLDEVTAEDVLKMMYNDKKVLKGQLRLILPREIGRCEIVNYSDSEKLIEAISGRLG